MNAIKEKKSEGAIAFLLNNKAIVILIGVVIIAAFLSEHFFTAKNLLNILRQVSTTGILAAAFTCVQACGYIDLSVGSLLGMLGIIMAKLSTSANLPFATVVVIAIGLGALCGAVNGLIITGLRVNFFIATLATQLVFRGINYVICNNSSISGLPPEYASVGQQYWGPLPVPVYIMILFTVIIAVILYRTTFGRHIVATGGNIEAARVSGVNVNAVIIGVYVIMGIAAAIGALIITGRAMSGQPSAGEGMEMDAIAAAVIGGTALSGGKGNVVGSIIGCILIGMIGNVLNIMGVNSNYQLIVKGLIILSAVVLDVQTAQFLSKRSIKQENA